MTNDYDDFDLLVAGAGLAPERVRRDIVQPDDLVPATDLDRRIVRLLMAHRDLKIEFRQKEMSEMDDATKRTFLRNIYTMLRMEPTVDER